MKLFDSIRVRRPRLNKFDLSHERKMSIDMGLLYPVMNQEILPGDKFRVNHEVFLRMAPMLAPIMHRVNVYVHDFFIPYRLVWDEWEDFITGGKDGTAAPVVPQMVCNGDQAEYFKKGTLNDYLGIPTVDPAAGVANPFNVSALMHRAYYLMWYEYFRDQNVSTMPEPLTTSGVITLTEMQTITAIMKRAWEKDYFTSALPWAQRGPEVLMPIEGDATVTYKDGANQNQVFNSDGTAIGTGGDMTIIPGTGGGGIVRNAGTNKPINIQNIDNIEFENSTVTINDLRRSIRLQEWLEKNARGGARYIEQILSHFGVKSSDARLQRPEYLGGGRMPIGVSEVLSTYQDPEGAGDPQANMAGRGISVGNPNGFSRTFEEHGCVISVMSVLPRTAYHQGIPKPFTRFDKFDHYWPEFANIGEQEVKLRELWYDPNQAGYDGDKTFGYQSRYAEYKYSNSSVHGDMRDQLDYWHMGRKFFEEPTLSEDFVMSNPTKRIYAVDDETVQHLYCYVYNKISALRPMPYYGTPTL